MTDMTDLHTTDMAKITRRDDYVWPRENLVRGYVFDAMQGKSVPAPTLVRYADGRLVPLGEDADARVEAVRRLGGKTLSAYIVDARDPQRLREIIDLLAAALK